MTTVAAAVVGAADRLRAAGLTREDADRDAAVLARGLLHWSLADWLSHRHEIASEDWTAAFDALILRRCAYEPVAYLLGRREFYGRDFGVQAGVLVPRPETELLIDAALRWLRSGHGQAVVDVGTGSGCVAVTLALEVANLTVAATDASDIALLTARQNADALGATRISWHHGDLLADVPGPLDLVVSNPPYVPTVDRPQLSPDVRDYEPALALFAGADGLDVIRRLIPAAAARLKPGGALMMEVGAGQSHAVTSLLGQVDFHDVTWHTDLQGIDRVVAATYL